MFIHKSHSKNELVKIVEAFHIPITNPRQYRKIDLSALIMDRLNQTEFIIPCDDYWFGTLIDLKHYLLNINPKKILTIKEKSNVINICKRIKHYCRNGLHVDINGFGSVEDVYKEAEYIKKYGDIPSVRKSIRELNNSNHKLYTIEPIVSLHVQKELAKKEQLRQKCVYKCEIKYGTFYVTFP